MGNICVPANLVPHNVIKPQPQDSEVFSEVDSFGEDESVGSGTPSTVSRKLKKSNSKFVSQAVQTNVIQGGLQRLELEEVKKFIRYGDNIKNILLPKVEPSSHEGEAIVTRTTSEFVRKQPKQSDKKTVKLKPVGMDRKKLTESFENFEEILKTKKPRPKNPIKAKKNSFKEGSFFSFFFVKKSLNSPIIFR